MKIGEISKPRFEFRSFGQCFCEAHKRMARLSVPVPEKVWERSSDEIYIISRKNDINNTKIRGGKMDIKTYVQTVDGLEQWNPLMKGEFPISREVLEKEVFPAFMVEMPAKASSNIARRHPFADFHSQIMLSFILICRIFSMFSATASSRALQPSRFSP